MWKLKRKKNDIIFYDLEVDLICKVVPNEKSGGWFLDYTLSVSWGLSSSNRPPPLHSINAQVSENWGGRWELWELQAKTGSTGGREMSSEIFNKIFGNLNGGKGDFLRDLHGTEIILAENVSKLLL